MIRSILRHVNNMKLRTKLSLTLITVVFVPVLAVGLLLTVQLRDMALDNAVEQTASNVDRVKQRTLEAINVSADIAYRLAYDKRLEEVATREYKTLYEVVAAYRDYREFRAYNELYNEIASIRFYVDNPTLLNNWEFMQPSQEIVEAGWYLKAMDSRLDTVSIHYLRDERDNRYYLSLVRKVNFRESKGSGILVINVNMNVLGTILRQEAFETMIVDDSNTIVSANRFEHIGKKLHDIDFDAEMITAREGMFEIDRGSGPSRIMIEPLVPEASVDGLRIITVFSIESITADVDRIQRTAMTVILAALLVSIGMTYAFSGILTQRMRRLSKQITKVATGNLDSTMEIDGGDEIGQLSRQFNSMVASINRLMAEVQETNRQRHLLETKQNEIKFKMMASQINPHFLFNALESIRMKAHLKGEKEISQVVRLLGKLMRRNLEVSRRKTRLADEIDIVRCYLDIQRFRYEERLRYELIVDPEVEAMPVPPLIIQPIVENAVLHGLEGKEEGGQVTVRVIVIEGEVQVEVVDNGIGMDESKLHQLQASLHELDDEEEKARIGLRNVHMRLQLTYGPDNGLRIESKPGIGTRVAFTLPLGGVE